VWSKEQTDVYTSAGGREVCEEEIQEILAADKKPVTVFWQDKYEKEARRMWDVFYKVNADKFFKDRHYLEKEFPVLKSGAHKLLDVGCGVGNATIPLLAVNPDLRIWASDFSDNAVQMLQKSAGFDAERCTAFTCDLTSESVQAKVGGEAMDLCLMIFVLSAIHPDKMVHALQNVAGALRPGGKVLFRDYGLYDMAQLRMAEPRGHKLCDNFYVRKDGTRAYYFTEVELAQMFLEAGFETESVEMHRRVVKNRKEGSEMHRRWVQGVFSKSETTLSL